MIARLSELFPNFQQEAQSRLKRIQKECAEKLIHGTKSEAVDVKIFKIVADFISKMTDSLAIFEQGPTPLFIKTSFNFIYCHASPSPHYAVFQGGRTGAPQTTST